MSYVLKRNNFFSMDLSNYNKSDSKNIDKIVKILEKDKLVIVSGMKNIGKQNFIKDFLNTTNSNNNYFYFDKNDDLENHITDSKSLKNLLNEYIKLYRIPNYIILQNISQIDGIKDFIAKIYEDNYKTLLIGNSIKIGGIKEVEILNKISINDENLNQKLHYGSLYEIGQLESVQLKEKFLKLITNDIFVTDIFKNFSVKNIDLYNFTMSYLSYYNSFFSLRELHRSLNDIKSISLKTVIDYMEFSLHIKILKRVYRFDVKNNRKITTKAKYYFTDNGIRNSLSDFQTNDKILVENMIFNILEYNNYKIYSGINGKFEFSFYAKKPLSGTASPSQEKEAAKKSIYIQISEQTRKEEIKKEVNKLLKIGNEGKKYLLVESREKLGIKKLKYDSVEIIEINDFLERFGK